MAPRGMSMLTPSRMVRSPRRKTRSLIRMIGSCFISALKTPNPIGLTYQKTRVSRTRRNCSTNSTCLMPGLFQKREKYRGSSPACDPKFGAQKKRGGFRLLSRVEVSELRFWWTADPPRPSQLRPVPRRSAFRLRSRDFYSRLSLSTSPAFRPSGVLTPHRRLSQGTASPSRVTLVIRPFLTEPGPGDVLSIT
jgi:hypothetical protein